MVTKWIVLGIAVAMYALVIAFQEKKVWFTSFAALAVVLLGVILPGQVFPDSESRLYPITHRDNKLERNHDLLGKHDNCGTVYIFKRSCPHCRFHCKF